MFTFSTRRKKQRGRGRGWKTCHLEYLEDRLLLTANPGPALLDLDGLQVDHGSYDPESILVRFQPGVVPAQGTGNQIPHSILDGSQSRPLLSWWPDLQQITLPPSIDVETALAAYRDSDLVLYAEHDYRVQVDAIPDDFRFGEMWSLDNQGQTGGTVDADIDAPQAWDVHTGSGSTIVAVIDSGVDYLHPDLADNIWVNPGEIPGDGVDNDGNGYVDDVHGYDFFNDDGDPMDDFGHGTHVAGTIGAVGNNGLGVTGINWNVQIMALKFLGTDGSGSSSDAIEAISYAVANGASISNNSWGGDPPSQAMFDAISAARDADHIFVAAAGNGNAFGIGQNNDTTLFYPASYDLDNVIAVAASDHNDDLASFSNFGETTVDLAAPGVNILSTTVGGGYGLNSGTSMATPHVAGVVALLRDLHPTWTYDQIINQVLSTVDPLPQFLGVTATGGRLNAAAALGNPEPPPPPPSPVPLPIINDFSAGLAEGLVPQIGNWDVNNGRYDVQVVGDDDNLEGISTFNLTDPLPANLTIETTLNADEGRLEVLGIVFRDNLTNGLVIFDYHSRTDYKFAGADMVQDRWVIGHRDSIGWHTDAFVSSLLDAATNYQVRLTIDNHTVTLLGDGITTVTHTYSDDLNDGLIGLGMRNSTTHFDNVLVYDNTPPTPGSLPLLETFEDGVADHFQRQAGIAEVSAGRYEVTSFVGQDAVQTILFDEPLPANLELQTVINANAAGGGYLSNGLLIFDYQGPTDFKFAGAFVGIDQWVIGHRDASGWVTDATLDTPIEALTDYTIQVVVENDTQVTLSVDGIPQISHNFTDSVTDGQVGIGTQSAVTRFDEVLVQAFVPLPTSPLPLTEDFEDGTADYLDPRTGVWTVSNGRYAANPLGGQDALSTLRLVQPLPANLQLDVTINADPASGGLLSNAFVIFDYQGPTDFKFAGAFVGIDQWVIGHRDASGWVTDVLHNAPINALADHNLRLVIDGDATVTLYVAGLPQVNYTYAGSLTDGLLGLGTNNAVSRFDDLQVAEVLPPDPPTPGTLPLVEDFEDGSADHFQQRSGAWVVEGGQYGVIPLAGQDGVSTLLLSESLPADLEVQATFQAQPGTADYLSNAFILFDYQGPTDFKFAGAYVGSDQWLIGHRDASGWVVDASLAAPIDALTDYAVKVVIEDSSLVTLYVGGAPYLSHTYSGSLTDGLVGVGTRNALSQFDDVLVQAFVPPPTSPLPLSEDFEDGTADFLDPIAGTWTVSNGRDAASPVAGQDALSTLRLVQPLPVDLQLDVTINADAASGGLLSNAFIIFDYQGPTDFKFAGAFVGINQWAIGHRDASGWVADVVQNVSINALADYDLRLVIEGDAMTTLYVDGLPQVSHTYAGSLTDGLLGLGTNNAVSRFDDLQVGEVVPPEPPAPGTLPLVEDFEDGSADHFQQRSGAWVVEGGQYGVIPLAGQDGVSTLLLSGSLPADLEVQATFQAQPATSGYLSNAFILFDYQGPTDFKFAGAYVGSDQWLIGHRDASGWVVDASLAAPIDALTDHDLRVIIENSSEVSLYANGVYRLSFTYAGSLSDGLVGLGTQNAVSWFDDLQVQAFVPPPSLTFGVPEDFQDGEADSFEVRIGTWTVTGGRYEVTPTVGMDGISTIRIDGALPDNLEFVATINANPTTVDFLSNAFLIFDYQGPTDFKFAGAYVGADQWLIGHRDASGWVTDVWINAAIAANTDHDVRLVITNHTDVALYANGVLQVSAVYADAVTDGKLGLGTTNAVARFDDVLVQEFTSPSAAVLPHTEDFDDGVADFLQVRSGDWTLSNGRFAVTPEVNKDGITTLQVSDPLPPNLDLRVLINANPGSSSYLSNALIIFDYQGPTDFKFAGAYVGANLWVIGHRDAFGWHSDAEVGGTINALADYNLKVIIQNGTQVSLYENDTLRVSFTYGDLLTDGAVGLGTRNAIARFDNFQVQSFSNSGQQVQTTTNFAWLVEPAEAGLSPSPALDQVLSQLGNHLPLHWWSQLASILLAAERSTGQP